MLLAFVAHYRLPSLRAYYKLIVAVQRFFLMLAVVLVYSINSTKLANTNSENSIHLKTVEWLCS
jgi:hypothetical protein